MMGEPLCQMPSRPVSRLMKQACLLLATLRMTGRTSIWPGTVVRDRFDYTGAVAESRKSQILLKLVKLPYGATPVFLLERRASRRDASHRAPAAVTLTGKH
jgi:hypothetical protein